MKAILQGQKVESSNNGFVAQATEPENTKLLWIDTGNNSIMKYYDENSHSWQIIPGTWL